LNATLKLFAPDLVRESVVLSNRFF